MKGTRQHVDTVMNHTDDLDAYLDQHCKHSTKNLLCAKPPRHGVRSKASSSLKKPSSATKHLPKPAWPLLPASSLAQTSKDINVGLFNNGGLVVVSKKGKVWETPISKTAQHCALMSLVGNTLQQQTGRQPSMYPQQHKEASGESHKAKVKLDNSLSALPGEACLHACFACRMPRPVQWQTQSPWLLALLNIFTNSKLQLAEPELACMQLSAASVHIRSMFHTIAVQA